MKKVILIFALFAIYSCKKKTSPVNSLPPITQTGANTLGFLGNNDVWIPRGNSNLGTNPRILYDLNTDGIPFILIKAEQIDGATAISDLTLVADSVTTTGDYIIWKNQPGAGFLSTNYPSECGMYSYDTVNYKTGKITVTKLDLTNHIIAGTFNLTYKTDMCDTMKITDGRFDMHF